MMNETAHGATQWYNPELICQALYFISISNQAIEWDFNIVLIIMPKSCLYFLKTFINAI